jgi:hypothetical protein
MRAQALLCPKTAQLPYFAGTASGLLGLPMPSGERPDVKSGRIKISAGSGTSLCSVRPNRRLDGAAFLCIAASVGIFNYRETT